jgi:hypothetical protein
MTTDEKSGLTPQVRPLFFHAMHRRHARDLRQRLGQHGLPVPIGRGEEYDDKK